MKEPCGEMKKTVWYACIIKYFVYFCKIKPCKWHAVADTVLFRQAYSLNNQLI